MSVDKLNPRQREAFELALRVYTEGTTAHAKWQELALTFEEMLEVALLVARRLLTDEQRSEWGLKAAGVLAFMPIGDSKSQHDQIRAFLDELTRPNLRVVS